MNRSLALIALSLAACATDETPEAAPKEEVVEMDLAPAQLGPALDEKGQPIPGTLALDTSEGRMDITDLVPEKPREFGSREEFHKWALETLNAELVEREGGYGTSVSYTASAALLRDPATGEYELVEDPIEKIIGGREGYIVIDGEKHCASRHAPCAEEMGLEPAERPAERKLVWGATTASGPSGLMGVLGVSWHSFPKAFVPFVTAAGSSTTQWNAPGGLRLIWVTCSTNIYKTCLVSVGSNVISTSFAARRGGGTIRTGFNIGFNTLSVVSARFDFDVYPFTGTDNICARHTGLAAGDFIATDTGSLGGVPVNNCP